MKPILAAMRRAGITRSRFSARFRLRDHRGYIMLQEIETPIGQIDHAWIRPGQWHGTVPRRGERIAFRASLEPYWRESGEPDVGLFKLEVIER